MGNIIDFFKKRGGGSKGPGRDVRELVAPLSRPAVQLVHSGIETESHFGGSPTAGSEISWPCRSGKPLTFLASIHLPTLQNTHAFEWIPSDGSLCFFYDAEQQPWGFDPKDGDGWAVYHVPEGAGIEISPLKVQELPRRYMEFRRIDTYPSWERPDVQLLNLSDPEADALSELADSSYGESAKHQVGGYPNPIQGDRMEIECQLVSSGINRGDGSGYQSEEAKRLESGEEDWRLLLQLASDDELGTMWGDVGNLYCWIREQDGKERRFDRVWTVLQCF